MSLANWQPALTHTHTLIHTYAHVEKNNDKIWTTLTLVSIQLIAVLHIKPCAEYSIIITESERARTNTSTNSGKKWELFILLHISILFCCFSFSSRKFSFYNRDFFPWIFFLTYSTKTIHNSSLSHCLPYKIPELINAYFCLTINNFLKVNQCCCCCCCCVAFATCCF